MSIGYFADLADAEDYFSLERLESTCWDDLGSGSGGGLKDRVLLNAYNRIFYDPRWSLPLYASASAAELVRLRKANGEMAYYLCQHLADEDRRKGIQAQGVAGANVVGETYVRFKSDSLSLDSLPVPPFVIALLSPWTTTKIFGAVKLSRDEEDEDMEL